jgi:hypothetical protein
VWAGEYLGLLPRTEPSGKLWVLYVMNAIDLLFSCSKKAAWTLKEQEMALIPELKFQVIQLGVTLAVSERALLWQRVQLGSTA